MSTRQGSANGHATVPSLDTWDSKLKGDEGVYAAIDAAALARALRGATVSRLVLLSRLNTASHSGQVVLGEQPSAFAHNSVDEARRATMLEVLRGDREAALYTTQPAVGVPDELMLEELRHLLPSIKRLKPDVPMSYDDLLRLLHLLNLNGASVTTLDVGGVVSPVAVQPETSVAALQKKVEELRARYPLPTPAAKNPDADSDPEDDDENEEANDPDQYRHNAELRERCERLQINYSSYATALVDVARLETRVFVLLCQFLAKDRTIRVVQLDHNDMGGESSKAEGSVDMVPLRALAAMIDANETIKVLDLSHNKLGANGVGIVAKALTKNISLVVVDLSSNQMNAEPLEELEDPEYVEEDPVFGETYSGLIAISEVLKKNKFIRALRLADNGIHAGDDATSVPPEENAMEEFQPEEDALESAAAIDAWEDIPLWKLLQPLTTYHRLEVLDLTGNKLQVRGTRMVATALATNTSLRVLDLTDNNIGFRGLHYVAKLVLASPTSTIHTLVLRQNNLAGKRTSRRQQKAALSAMKAFAESLRGSRTVRRLLLSNNHLGADLSAALLDTIGTAEVLEELDFEYNDACGEHATSFDPRAAHLVASALYPNSHRWQPTLCKLRFGGNNLRDAGAAILLPTGFAPPHSLREIDLSRNQLGNGLGPISNVLIGSTTVTRLGLAHNAISSAAALLPGLAQSTTIAELDLSHNQLGDQELLGCAVNQQVEGVAQLLRSLASCESLTCLDISWNDLKPAHADHVGAIFSQPGAASHLKKLDISNNPKIPQHQVAALTRQLASRPGLEVFYASVPLTELAATQPAMLELLEGVVRDSGTLLDVSCGLRGLGSAALDEAETSVAGDRVGSMRRHLLLNALMASKRGASK